MSTLERSDTHPEELIEIIGEDSEKAETLQHRYGLVLRLLQHARIK
jgi:hypothetical protein